MEKLVLQDVVRIFKKNVGVLGVSLEVKEGEFFVILGPSGCGKTTTLRMIAGLETVDSGHIFLDEREITNFPPKLRNISMVFQNYALYPFMTVKDNILFPLKILKMPKSEMDQKVEEIGMKLGIMELMDRKACFKGILNLERASPEVIESITPIIVETPVNISVFFSHRKNG